MYYFDLLRLRGSLKVYSLILAGFVGFMLISIPFSTAGHNDVNIGINGEAVRTHTFHGFALLHELGQKITIPFWILCVIAGSIAAVYGTTVSTSLSRVNTNLHLWFTRPVSRERSTLTTIAFDAIAIAIGFAIALVAVLIPIAAVGLLDRIRFDGDAVRMAFGAISVGYMWYALVQAVTSGMRSRAQLFLGLSWPTFIIFHSLAELNTNIVPSYVVLTIRAIDVINPLSYFNVVTVNMTDSHGAPMGAGGFGGLYTVWATILICVAIAVVVRRRMEV